MTDLLEKYTAFLESKAVAALQSGFEVSVEELNPILFPHQKDVCRWAIAGGCRAIFASFGLGKTVMQIQVIKTILDRVDAAEGNEDSAGLIICPLGVKAEFVRDAKQFFGIDFHYVRTDDEVSKYPFHRYFITNYERVRDGQPDPNLFTAVSLDEASILRSFGSKTYQEFLPLFHDVPYRFVCTATPAPNRFKELIHYAGFLGIMDTGQALTRFFKRNSQKAGELTIHPHKEREFWLWVSTWATFLTKPSDLGYSDEGYDLPPLNLIEHRLPVDHTSAGVDSWGTVRMFREASGSIQYAAREKRDSLDSRIQRMLEIIATDPDGHWLIWHDLEDERRAIEQALPGAVTAYGSQDLDERESAIAAFSEGRINILATKPVIAGSGCNFQRHCHRAIYLGVGYKFNDFIQSVHRIQRFLQSKPVDIHLIFTESEDNVYATLMQKWAQHKVLVQNMTDIIKTYGLTDNMKQEMKRSLGLQRQVITGKHFTAANNDNVLETADMPDNSVGLIVTSWPFGNHYEYSASFNDFGHNEDDDRFFEQMDYLTPNELRILKPGRMYCLHVKDRLLYGSVTGLGMYSVNPFSDKCVAHMIRHGFIYEGRITIDTDVVRENAQTYRLGYTEQCKDGSKMGVGSPEYILLFRKLPTELTNAYADEPVVKEKSDYSRCRWQLDASSIWRSNGNSFLTPEKVQSLEPAALKSIWKKFAENSIYDYEQHVQVLEAREEKGLVPSGFMLLQPHCQSKDWIWEDVARMRTLNTVQVSAKKEMHICPLQFDVVERLIRRFSNDGDLVYDPFGGLMTVPYCAVKLGRRGYGCELNPEYWADGVYHLRALESKMDVPTLFDLVEAELEMVDSL
jgi:hypothetical protein